MMICDRRSVLALVGSVAFVGTASAKHNHNSGPQLLGSRLNTNGKHEIHKVGEHTIHVHVENKKIAGVSVTHRTKGNVAVKKYKTNRKMAQGNDIDAPMETTGRLIQPAGYQLAQAAGVYIGYSLMNTSTGSRQTWSWTRLPGRSSTCRPRKFNQSRKVRRATAARRIWFARIRPV
jgi:hypothetical protein